MRRATILAVAIGFSGCYATQIDAVRATGDVRAAPVEHEHRQYFTLAGAVPLNDPVGDECARRGLATATSELGTLDLLLELGLSLGSAYVATTACKSDDAAARASCVGLIAPLGPILLGSRTVRYRCAIRIPHPEK